MAVELETLAISRFLPLGFSAGETDKLKILIVISQPKRGLIIAEQPGDANRLGVLGETDPDFETVVEALEKLIEMNLI